MKRKFLHALLPGACLAIVAATMPVQMLGQNRDFHAERIVLDDAAGDGGFNSMTLQVPGTGLTANRTLTFPDADGSIVTQASPLVANQILFGGPAGQAAQSANLLFDDGTGTFNIGAGNFTVAAATGNLATTGNIQADGTIQSGSSIIIDGTTPGSHNITATAGENLTITPSGGTLFVNAPVFNHGSGLFTVDPGAINYNGGALNVTPVTFSTGSGLFSVDPGSISYNAGLFTVDPGTMSYSGSVFTVPGIFTVTPGPTLTLTGLLTVDPGAMNYNSGAFVVTPIGGFQAAGPGSTVGDGNDAEQLEVNGVDGGAIEVDVNGDMDVSGTLTSGTVNANTLTDGAGSTITGGAATFNTITGAALPAASTSTDLVTSNAGALETRTVASLTGLIGVSSDATLTGDGTTGNPLGIDLTNANSWTGAQTFSSVDINGGTIDGTTIGGTTPAAGTFTAISDGAGATITGGTVTATTLTDGIASMSGGTISDGFGASMFGGTVTGFTLTDGIASMSGGTISDGFGASMFGGTVTGFTLTDGIASMSGGTISDGAGASMTGGTVTGTTLTDGIASMNGGTISDGAGSTITGGAGTFATITGTGLPAASTSTDIVTSNGGGLETRTAASLAGTIGVSSDATLTGDGTTGSPLGIDLTNANTWTGTQTFGQVAVLSIATFDADVTLGDSPTDALTANGTFAGATPLAFEGATSDVNETTFAITDPTADRTITFQDASGTVAFLSDITVTTNSTLLGDGTGGDPLRINLSNTNTWTGTQTFGQIAVLSIATFDADVTLGDSPTDALTANGTFAGATPLSFEGATSDVNETTFAITDPTADRTITFQDASGTVAFLSDIAVTTNSTLLGDGSGGDPLRINLSNANSWTGAQTFSSVDINGGTIDGTTIGGTTPAAGTFTTISDGAGTTIAGGTVTATTLTDGIASMSGGTISDGFGASMSGGTVTGFTLTDGIASMSGGTISDGFGASMSSGTVTGFTLTDGIASMSGGTISDGFGASLTGGTVTGFTLTDGISSITGGAATFNTITGAALPAASTSTDVVVSNAGALETRTVASLTGSLGVSSDATLTGDGTTGSPLGIDLTNANSWTGAQTFSSVDINGGTIDGTTIGATTPAAASVTNLVATGTSDLQGNISNSTGSVTVNDNFVVTAGSFSDFRGPIGSTVGNLQIGDAFFVNSGGATDMGFDETSIVRNSGATETIAIDNPGAGDISILVNGAGAVANSRLTINDGHWTSQQTTAPVGAAAGANVTSAALSNETDVAGLVDITTSGTPAAGAQATITFDAAYGTAPIVVLTAANGAAAGIGAHVTRTTAGFTISFIGVPAASTSYQFFYQVIETQ